MDHDSQGFQDLGKDGYERKNKGQPNEYTMSTC